MKDYSADYALDKKGHIFIGSCNRVVKFKPFIKSLSYETKYENINNVQEAYANPTLSGPMESIAYKLSFDVIASSIEEAIENHKKFQFFIRMLFPRYDDVTEYREVYVKFSNIIHGGDARGYEDLSYTDLSKKGLECTIRKVDYKPDYQMGFFESNGLVFAKVYSIDLVIEVTSDSSRKKLDIGELSGFNYGNGSRAPLTSASLNDFTNIIAEAAAAAVKVKANPPVNQATDTVVEDTDQEATRGLPAPTNINWGPPKKE